MVSGPLVAWEMEPIAISSSKKVWVGSLAQTAATLQPFGLTTECFGHAAQCLAGGQTRAAWKERPATAAAMVLIGCGIGLVTTVNKTVKTVDRQGRLFIVVPPFVSL